MTDTLATKIEKAKADVNFDEIVTGMIASRLPAQLQDIPSATILAVVKSNVDSKIVRILSGN